MTSIEYKLEDALYFLDTLALYADGEATHEIEAEKAVVVPVDAIYMAQARVKEAVSLLTDTKC